MLPGCVVVGVQQVDDPPHEAEIRLGESSGARLVGERRELALRLAVGCFVVGWKPESMGSAPDGKYSLFGFRDTSSLLSGCNRPEQPIKIYEYEPSPYCRKVREACTMLDVARKVARAFKRASGKLSCPIIRTNGWSLKVPHARTRSVQLYHASFRLAPCENIDAGDER